MKFLRTAMFALGFVTISLVVLRYLTLGAYAIVGTLIGVVIVAVLFRRMMSRLESEANRVYVRELIGGWIGLVLIALLLGLFWPSSLFTLGFGGGRSKTSDDERADDREALPDQSSARRRSEEA